MPKKPLAAARAVVVAGRRRAQQGPAAGWQRAGGGLPGCLGSACGMGRPWHAAFARPDGATAIPLPAVWCLCEWAARRYPTGLRPCSPVCRSRARLTPGAWVLPPCGRARLRGKGHVDGQRGPGPWLAEARGAVGRGRLAAAGGPGRSHHSSFCFLCMYFILAHCTSKRTCSESILTFVRLSVLSSSSVAVRLARFFSTESFSCL